MVHTFVSSHAIRLGTARFGVASFSVLAHASLITFAVVASGPRPSTLSSARTIPVEELRFVAMPEVVHHAASGAFARALKKAVRLLVPDMTKLHAMTDASLATLAKIPDVSTEIDFSSRISDARDFGDVDTQQLVDTRRSGH